MRAFRTGLLICALAVMAAPVRAAGPLLQEAIGLMGPIMWLSSGAPGLVLGVVNGNDTIVTGYGHVRPPGEHPEQPNPEPDGRTLIRLGSVSKAFAGELLARLVVEGRVRLTDPLQRFLPPDVTVPKFGDRSSPCSIWRRIPVGCRARWDSPRTASYLSPGRHVPIGSPGSPSRSSVGRPEAWGPTPTLDSTCSAMH